MIKRAIGNRDGNAFSSARQQGEGGSWLSLMGRAEPTGAVGCHRELHRIYGSRTHIAELTAQPLGMPPIPLHLPAAAPAPSVRHVAGGNGDTHPRQRKSPQFPGLSPFPTAPMIPPGSLNNADHSPPSLLFANWYYSAVRPFSFLPHAFTSTAIGCNSQQTCTDDSKISG